MSTVGALGEADVIRMFAGRLRSGPEILVENGDDAAVVRAPFGDSDCLVATTDTLIEHIHFELTFSSPREVGRKLMSVNLSDVAAMGGEPRYVLLSVCLPADFSAQSTEEIAHGIHERAAEFEVEIIGGNVARTTGPVVLTATVLAAATEARVVKRMGCAASDGLFVTGTLGDAKGALDLVLAGRSPAPTLLARLVDPTPRVREGLALAASGVLTGMCDVSDGMGKDLRRLLEPNRLGAVVDRAKLPISEALATVFGDGAADLALSGGEDYELLFTAPVEAESDLSALLEKTGTRLTRIGEVTAEAGAWVRGPDGQKTELLRGFDHF